MGTMNKLRENTGVVLWILVFAFGVIWVLQDSGGLDAVGTGGAAAQGNILVVDGDAVSAEEYSRRVEAQVQQFQNRTGQAVTPQMRDQVRESVYNALVAERLRAKEMDRLGIRVTDAEVEDMVLGADPHPIIRAYFSDSTGQVNRQLLNSFISNPDATQDLIQIEQAIRAQRRQEKLDNLIGATVHVSREDVEDAYRRQNLKKTARYVALPYADVPAGEVEITDEDLRAYYDANREDFRRERTYTVRYAVASKSATAQDTAQVRQELEGLRARFAEAESDSLFLMRNASERPFSSAYLTPDAMQAPLADAIYPDPEAGRVVGPVFAGDLAHLVKITGVRPAEETYVRARHILLQGEGEEAPRARAEELKAEIEAGADFAEVARRASEGPSASRGGDLGWFGPGRMAEAFEEAALSAPVGEIVGPVETPFGLHLIQVEARADQAVQVADMAVSTRPSPATLDDIEEKLGDAAYYASEDGNFAEEVERQGFSAQTATVEAGAEGMTVVPGLGPSRAIASFLETAAPGAISEVVELDEQFVVLGVEEVQEAGYRPFEEVQAEVRPRVLKEKRQAVQRERLESALAEAGGSLDALASALGTEVRTQEGLTFSTQQVPVLGNDPAFVGTVFGLDEGAASRVVTGENAAFVAEVTAVDEPLELTEAKRQQLRQQLQRRRRAEVQNRWIATLREGAEVEDYRAQFER